MKKIVVLIVVISSYFFSQVVIADMGRVSFLQAKINQGTEIP